jgi:hypothetical protein
VRCFGGMLMIMRLVWEIMMRMRKGVQAGVNYYWGSECDCGGQICHQASISSLEKRSENPETGRVLRFRQFDSWG